MGIKFHCPNGHKLNVKSFLAGKRGVCPKCGTSLRIPLESTRGTDLGSPADDGEGDDLLDEAKFPAPGRSAALSRATAAPVAEAPLAKAVAPVAVAVPMAVPVAAPASDPIADAPTAVWYVRPPAGDQYGPARGDIMRRWIAEGRVSTDSLVWREGWADWQTAGDVFPSLKSSPVQSPSPPASPAVAEKDHSPAAQPTMPARSARLATRYESRKKQGNGLGIAIIVMLGLLCVVLAALLVYLFAFSAPEPSGTKTKGAAKSSSIERVVAYV